MVRYSELKTMVANISSCYGLNVCVPLKFIYWNLTPKVMALGGGAIGRWLGCEGAVLLDGLCAFINEAQGSSFTSSAKWGQRKDTIYELGSGLSRNTESVSALSLDSQLPDMREITFCCLWATQPVAFCRSSPDEDRIMGKKAAMATLEGG